MIQLAIETFQKTIALHPPFHTLSPNNGVATVSAIVFLSKKKKKKVKKKEKKKESERKGYKWKYFQVCSSISGFALASQMCQIFPSLHCPLAFIFVKKKKHCGIMAHY
jgi:hypothetical protein